MFNKVVACYFSNWAHERPGQAAFSPENLQGSGDGCTHIFYAFANLDPRTLLMAPSHRATDVREGYVGQGEMAKLQSSWVSLIFLALNSDTFWRLNQANFHALNNLLTLRTSSLSQVFMIELFTRPIRKARKFFWHLEAGRIAAQTSTVGWLEVPPLGGASSKPQSPS